MTTLPQQLERVVLALCEDVDSPVSREVARLLREKDYKSLVNLTVDPRAYDSARRYSEDVACVDFLRKYTGFVIDGIDKAQVALDNFFVAEKACCRTNVRLHKFVKNQGPFEDPGDLRLIQSFDWMRSWIRDVLGPLPKELGGRFGPGSTFHDVGRLITVPDKMTSRPTVTKPARCLLTIWSQTAWCRALLSSHQNRSDPEDVRGNRFTTVPKDARKDRGIAIEPSINVFYQLAVGKVIRNRLRLNANIDLKFGQELHRRLAREASRTGSHATIDLSNASDTVSYNLVKILLPEGWFLLLDTLRSPRTLVRGRWHHLQKFSSMGNGYTFELETLIFSAIAAHACHLDNVDASHEATRLSVYGDDIILPVKASGTFLALLKLLGFTPNPEKTFTDGKFRESCGGDFFDGLAVRPYYQKDVPDEPANWIRMANGIRRLGHQDSFSDFRYGPLWRAWQRALEPLPTDIRRLRGPEDLGDLVIHDTREFWQYYRNSDGWAFFRTWSPVNPKIKLHHWSPDVVLAAALYGIPSDGVANRDSVSGYRMRWTTHPY